MLRSEKKFIEQVLKAGERLSKEVAGHSPRILIRSLRKRLRMTQTQLAKRVGLPQSYIAKIESGTTKPTIETLEKIFRGLCCVLAYLPVPDMDIDKLMEQRAREVAEKKVRYVAGTMALENQLPPKKAIEEMVKEETKRLLNTKTSEIWD